MLESVLQYTTPVYVSMDQPRSMTLFYSSSQARPRGFVEIEALESSPEPAAYMTLEVRDAAGALQTLDNGLLKQYYATGAGLNRIAASFDAGALATGMYSYTAIVTSHWTDGGSTPPVQIGVRVPVVNEGGSRYGSGWTLAGIGRVHSQADGALVTDGAGGVLWFAKAWCTTNINCSYTSPAGEPSTLRMIEGWFQRDWPDGGVVQYHGTGRMATSRDRFGNQTVLYYDATLTQLGAIADPAGMVTSFTYHPGGYLRTIRDPGGRESYVWYNGSDVWQIHSPDARLALDSLTYAGSRITAYTDARRGRWSITYDAAGKVERIQAPPVTDGGITARATTSTRSREAAVLPLPGTGTSTAPARRVLPDSAVRIIVFAGDTTRILANPLGQPARVANARGAVTLRYNANGQVASVDDGRGNVVTYEYEPGRPYAVTSISTVSPDGGSDHFFEYGAYAALARVVEADGPVIQDVLDAMGRRTATVRDGDTIAWYAYDSSGRLERHTDAERHTVTYAYQPSGTLNLATVTSNGVATEHRYDGLGRQTRTLTDGIPGDSVGYDVMNRVASVTNAAGTTRFGYTVNGVDLDDVVDPLGQRYQFRHNVVGWLTHQIDPASQADTYGYYPATGALRTFTDRRLKTVDLQYDARGRPVQRTADGVATVWRYDPDGRWAVTVNPASYDSVNYDSEGKVTRLVTRRGGLEFSVHHTYDENNRPDSVIVSGPWGSGNSIYLYTSRGSLEALRDLAGRWTELRYNRDGLLDTLRLPTTDTAASSRRYTPAHQLAGVQSESAQQSREYGYSALGLVLRDSIWGGTAGVGWEHQYGYDALHRVTEWELHKFGRKRVCTTERGCVTEDTDSLAQSLTFSWDAVGNPTGAARDPGNRLRAWAGFSMDYDAAGNLRRKYNASGFDQSFTWNALGQLTRVDRTGVGSVTYDYDGMGRRVRRADQNTGAVVHYVYDGDDLVLEVDGSGNRIREYTYYQGIDTPHSMRQWANGEGGRIYYYQMHQPGHVGGLVNASNQLVNHYRYTPFGTPVNGFPVEGTPNPLQYMARELDSTTGLYYVRNRWYDPQQGRFISEDPIGLAGGINLYVYADNRPVMVRDPYGLNPRCSTGRFPAHDPRFGTQGTWYFEHERESWIGIAVGSVYLLCPTPPGRGPFQWGDGVGDRGVGGRHGAPERTRFCRRRPAPSPDVDLTTNVALAEWTRENVFLPNRLRFFHALVQYGGPWDYKQILPEYEPYGNWHYGVTGTAMGFGPQVLLRAAGWAQQRNDTSDPSWGNWWDLSGPFGDEPSDQLDIRQGIHAYRTGCAP